MYHHFDLDPPRRPCRARSTAKWLPVALGISASAFIAIASYQRSVLSANILAPRTSPGIAMAPRSVRTRAVKLDSGGARMAGIGGFVKRMSHFRDVQKKMKGYREIANKGLPGQYLETWLDMGYTLIDVRPKGEVLRGSRLHGSHHVPFLARDDPDAIEYWAISPEPNKKFLQDIKRQVATPKARLVVACGEGPMSLVAAKQLQDAGYEHVIWLKDGLRSVPDGVMARLGNDQGGYGNPLLEGGRAIWNAVLKSKAEAIESGEFTYDPVRQKVITVLKEDAKRSEWQHGLQEAAARLLEDQLKAISGY
eukprot:CAMPEP_0167815534 /NCGR_PEP_ID=MMETSP0112_2-20121227/3076_1 /TAXON_ID=91324 /ORGANISM="Lotharella globosa, Strain CCCM811" /LENGTH=307 /DNA_ID=CAMNT_0007714965 /DNA_START=27 /DNA_END=950 /DNA_ORIENTATION=-